MMVGVGVKKEAFDGKKVSDGQNKRRNSATGMEIRLKNSATVLGIKLGKTLGDNALACRYELKYRVSESKAAAIEQFVKSYLRLDRYSKLRRNGSYPVLTLYLDSKDLRLCRETLEGKKNRFKLRIRSYSDNSDSPCFFEIKRRVNRIIIKSRARTMRDDVAGLLRGRSLFSREYETDLKALEQFQLYMSGIGARPIVRLRYLRKAYESNSENRVRVTFDRKIYYNATGKPNLILNSPEWQRLAISFIVLEIKFTDRYPAWLSQMVKQFDLKIVSAEVVSLDLTELIKKVSLVDRNITAYSIIIATGAAPFGIGGISDMYNVPEPDLSPMTGENCR